MKPLTRPVEFDRDSRWIYENWSWISEQPRERGAVAVSAADGPLRFVPASELPIGGKAREHATACDLATERVVSMEGQGTGEERTYLVRIVGGKPVVLRRSDEDRVVGEG